MLADYSFHREHPEHHNAVVPDFSPERTVEFSQIRLSPNIPQFPVTGQSGFVKIEREGFRSLISPAEVGGRSFPEVIRIKQSHGK